jgi:hypothetical protein
MKNDQDRTRNYCSFLLRLKQVQTEDLQTWVASVQNTQTGQQQIFSNMDGLIQFLQTEFGDIQNPNESDVSASNGTQGLPVQ